MNRSLFRLTCAAMAAALTLVSHGAFAQASAVQITDAGQLIDGQSTDGQIDDYLLSNPYICVIIDDISHPHGFADTGGNIIDAASATGEDSFASMFTMFNNQFGRQANYDTIAIIDAGGGANVAQIRVTGVDSEDGKLQVQTDYYLGPDDTFVEVVTQITNIGESDIPQLAVGDALQWGMTTHFVPGWANENRNIPGDGYDIGGKTLYLPWAAGDGNGASYGYSIPSGSFDMSNGSTWSDPICTYLSLPKEGGVDSYTRYFFVGTGDIASVSEAVFEQRGTTVGTLSGTIDETVTGDPVAGAKVVITTTQCLGTDGAESYTIARTDASGNYSADLEPGTYYVVAQSPGRNDSTCATVAITASTVTTHDVTLSQSGTLGWNVTDGANPIPCKISLLYYPITAEWDGPILADGNYGLVGGSAILSPTGSGTTPVAPGDYQVWVSRGLEYEAHVENIIVTAGSTTTVNAVLTRSVDTTGYISGDLHLHMNNSADSGVSAENRIYSAACEGLEFPVITDHDYISDLTGTVASTGMGAWVNTCPGDEVTTNVWGHHNGYPLTPTGGPRNGALDHQELTPAQIFSALRSDPKNPAVQVNHPRAGGLGYYDICQLNPVDGSSPDPEWSDDYDAVEVYNGKRLYQIDQTLSDWYNLLNRGQKITGMGNTDSHQLYSQEIGYPRNWLRVGVDDPASTTEAMISDAVKSHASVLASGPFMELWVNGTPIGNQVTVTDAYATVHVKIQAPTWMTVDTLRLWVNGRLYLTADVPDTGIALRMDQDFYVELFEDAWIAAEATGGNCDTNYPDTGCVEPGCPGRMDPIVPPMYGTQPVCPFTHTNPVWVDHDGNSLFDPPGNPGLYVEPIADIRPVNGTTYENTRLGEMVTVRGTVTCPSWALDHRSNMIYFQDDSMDVSGVLSGGTVVYQYGLHIPDLQVGDYIQVTGAIDQFYGLLEMSDVSIDRLATGMAVPDPIVVTTDQLWDYAYAEQWEGMLIRINDVSIVGGTWPSFGYDASIDIQDASSTHYVTMRIDQDTDIDGSTAPTEPFDLIAVCGQWVYSAPYRGGYQPMPRRRVDIIESADPLRILTGPGVEDVTSCSATIRWYTSQAGDSTVDYGIGSLTDSEYDVTSVESHAISLTGLMPGSTYVYRVTSSGVSSEFKSFTTAASANPAIVSGPVAQVIDCNTAQIHWQTDAPMTSAVNYGLDAGYGSVETVAGERSFHLVTITGLTPETLYHYQASGAATSCGGGSLASGDFTFTTPRDYNACPEISRAACPVPFTVTPSGAALDFRFEWRGDGYSYHIYGLDDQASMDAGTYATKLCDLATNTAGTYAVNGVYASFLLTDGSSLPAGGYMVVAENAFGEGPYGSKTGGTPRTPDADGATANDMGCVIQPDPPAPGDILINEFLADPNYTTGDANNDTVVDTSDDEFVELVNVSGRPLLLDGVTISDSVAVRHTFPSDTVLGTCRSAVVFGGGTPTGFDPVHIVQTSSEGYLGLNNTGDTITVALPDATILDQYVYGAEGGNDVALVRNPEATTGPFVAHDTVGAMLDFSPTTDVNGSAQPHCWTVSTCTAVSASIDGVTPDTSVLLGIEQTFNGSGTGEGTLTYEWDFDWDGVPANFSADDSGVTVNYTYGTAGSRTAGLRVTDSCADPSPQTAYDTVSISVSSGGGTCTDITINEIDADQTGTDTDEYVELHNATGGAVDLAAGGYVLVQYNGSGDASYLSMDLTGNIADGGYYLIGTSTVVPEPDQTYAGASNQLQNGADAVAVYKGAGCDATDIPTGTAAAATIGPCTLVDALCYDTSDADDTALMSALNQTEQINENENGAKDTESIQRLSDSEGCEGGWAGNWKVTTPTPGASN